MKKVGLAVLLLICLVGCGPTLESMRNSDRVLGTRIVDRDTECVCSSILNTAKVKYSRRLGIPVIWDSIWNAVERKGEVFGQQTTLWGEVTYFSIYERDGKTVIVWKPMPGTITDISHHADKILDDSNLEACPAIKRETPKN
jgi:hypothetical protein